MGFYGNISGSTKSAFTFDKVYANRTLMDLALENGNDSVFLGRYVLIEYDDAPVSIWIVTRDGITRAYTDYELTQTLTPMANVVYRDENSAQTAHSTVDFYRYDIVSRQLVKIVDAQGPYQINYNTDVQKYGRGYDGTVWRKVYDPELNKYRYVLLAELNAAVPTFHLMVMAPNEANDAPSIDETDSTNLNYYIKYPGYIVNRFKPDSTGDVTVAQPTESWEYNSDGTEKQHNYNIGEQTVRIKFNKAGFAPQTHQTDLENDNVMGSNRIYWEAASTGRHYNVSLANPQGHTAMDVHEWAIELPVLGNIVHKMYDLIYGYTGTSRRISNWWKTSLTQSDRMYDMKTMVGCMNRVRDVLGYNVTSAASAPSATKNTEDNTLAFIGPDVQNLGGINSIYYYAKQPRYVQDDNGDFVYRDGAYRVANPVTTAANERMRIDYYDYIPTELTDINSSMYGLVVALNRLMGTGTEPGTVRDSDTIIGLMGRLSDIFGRVDVALVPYKMMYTDRYGIIRTAGAVNDRVGMYPFVPAYAEGNDPQPDNGNEYIMDGKGNWRYPVSYVLTNLVPVVNNNNRVRDPILAADTLNAAIARIEHEIAEIYGATAATSLDGITGTMGTTGVAGIGNFTRVAQILNNRTETIDERITDLRMWRYISVANNEEHLSSTVTDITAAAGQADSENNADTFYFKSGNKWIMLAMDTTNDKLTIGHKISTNNSTNVVGLIQSSATGWGGSNDQDNQITIPNFTIDEAGHVVAHSSNTYYLPNSFKYISIAAQSSAIANSTGNTTQIAADNSADTITLATANKWLTIANDATNDKITFGHITAWAQPQVITPSAEAGWQATKTTDNKITLPTFTFDEAGHLTAQGTIDFYLPHSFKSYAVLAQNSGTTASIGNTETVVADNSADTLSFGTDNKWLTIRANTTGDSDEIDDTIYIGHAYDGTAAGQSYGLLYSKKVSPTEQELIDHTYVNLDSNNTFEIPYFTVDNTGHIASASTQHVILPENFTTITKSNVDGINVNNGTESAVSATTLVDTLNFKGANKWIIAALNSKEVAFSHKLTSATAGTYGDSAAQTPDFGATFKVPYIGIDEAGHVTTLSEHTVTIKLPSIGGDKTGDNNVSNVLTDLTLTASTGALTRTYTNVGTLKLTGYAAIAAGSAALAVSDTINGAFAKLEARIAYEETNRGNAITTEVSDRNTAISNAIGVLTPYLKTGETTVRSALDNIVDDLEDYADQSEADAKTYTDNYINLTTADVASGADKTVKNAIAKAIADLQSYADTAESDANNYTNTELAKLNSDYATSTYMAATRAAIKAVDDKIGTIPSGVPTTIIGIIDPSNLIVASGSTKTVVNAIAKSLVDAKAYTDAELAKLNSNYATSSYMAAVRSAISGVNDKFGTFPTGKTTVMGVLGDYVQTTTLSDYVTNTSLSTTLSSYALKNDYLAKTAVETEVNKVLANYDLSLKEPDITFTADADDGLALTVDVKTGSTYTYTWFEDGAQIGNVHVLSGTSATLPGPLTGSQYSVTVVRTYNSMESQKSMTVTLE